MTTVRHSIIGLPRSGKTTFLAALWHLLNAGEVPTKLELDRLVGDHKHLNAIVESWMQCEEVQRTSIAAETSVSIYVHEPATGRKAMLVFPDLSGESFERQLATRSCSASYVELLQGLGGVLLFVTADRPEDGMTILDIGSVTNEAEELRSSGDANDTQEWTPQSVPQQVQIVELLQFLQRSPFEMRKRRVAVIVSAWDVVAESQRSPTQWLEGELPLLYQFLETNIESFEWRVYGVSAQGGDVKSEQRDELLNAIPSERITCIGPGSRTHDLTDPIGWLTAED